MMLINGGFCLTMALTRHQLPYCVCCATDWRPVFDFLVLLFNISVVYSSYFSTF